MSYTLTYPRYIDPIYFLLTGLPLIIGTIFTLTVNFYILRASKRQPEGVRKSEYLKWSAIINFTFALIALFLPDLRITAPRLTPQDLSIMSLFYILTGLISSVPFLISYGVLIFLFARQNQNILRWYLYTSSILFMIGYSIFAFYLAGRLPEILFISGSAVQLTIILFGSFSNIINLINILGFIFLLIHGIKNRDFNFKMAGIFFFIGTGITITYNLIIPFFVTF